MVQLFIWVVFLIQDLTIAHEILAQQKRTQQSVHLTGGILRHFRAFSTPEQNPALGVLSTPAHPQVTQTVRRIRMGDNFQNNLFQAKYKKTNEI